MCSGWSIAHGPNVQTQMHSAFLVHVGCEMVVSQAHLLPVGEIKESNRRIYDAASSVAKDKTCCSAAVFDVHASLGQQLKAAVAVINFSTRTRPQTSFTSSH